MDQWWNYSSFQLHNKVLCNLTASCSKYKSGPKLQNFSLKDWSKNEKMTVSVCVTKQAEPSVTRILIEIKCLVV